MTLHHSRYHSHQLAAIRYGSDDDGTDADGEMDDEAPRHQQARGAKNKRHATTMIQDDPDGDMIVLWEWILRCFISTDVECSAKTIPCDFRDYLVKTHTRKKWKRSARANWFGRLIRPEH